MNAQGIQRTQIFTAQGNILQLFYNPANSLVVVDLIAANEQGGTELLRQTLKEKQALKHTNYPLSDNEAYWKWATQ